jgi:PAS domain S-box-containing protein
LPDPDDGLLAALVRAADDAIYSQSLDGTITSWNEGAQRLYGYAADEVVGTSAVRFVPPDRPNDIGDLLARIGRGETVRQYETVHYSRDARRLQVVLTISPVRDGPGRDGAGPITGAVTVARGTGEISEYEATRLAAEERFRGILDVAPVALMIVDERGRIEFANPRAASLFGHDRYELMSVELVEVLPERVWSRRRQASAAAGGSRRETATERAPGGAPDTSPDAVGRRRDGTEFPVELGVNTLTVGGRRLVAVAVVDLSARHAFEDELRSTTETLRTLVDAAPVAVAVLDVNGVVRVWNQAAEALFGPPAASVVGRRLSEQRLVDERTIALLGRVLSGETIRSLEDRQARRDGSTIDVRVDGAPLRDGTGTIVGAVALVADVTATKNLEEQLLQAQKMESIGRLAGGVAHDFNNLLTGIFGYSSLLAEELDGTNDDAQELVSGIRESAERAAALTAQLLAFSRRQVLQPRVVELNDVVRGIEPLLRRIIGETVSLVTLPRPDVGRVRADPTQLEQVIVNLVVNARDAMPDGGTCVVETDEVTFDEAYAQEHFDVSPGRYVMLAVTDAGVGMDAETRLHLFEPFFTTKDQGKGTGLGLATTYGIVKQSGGHIWLYSEPDHGTTFKLYFPRVAEPSDVAKPATRTPIRAAPTETILLVEDDGSVREITRTVLARHGYRVLEAENGLAAIALSERYADPIDLLVTDVVMPGVGGRALAEQIQQRRPQIRTLFISGYTEDTIVRQGVLDAHVSFLAKPFAPETLARAVRDALTRPVNGSAGRSREVGSHTNRRSRAG